MREGGEWRWIALPLGIGALGAGLGLMMAMERFSLPASALVAAGFLVTVSALSWWRRPYAYALLVDLLLIFAYIWSLGETTTITITATPHGYIATIDGNVRILTVPSVGARKRPPTPPPRIGLLSGPAYDFIVTPLGGANYSPRPNLLSWLGQELRFITPGPAWADIHLNYTSGGRAKLHVLSPLDMSGGRWSINPRGELQGPQGSTAFLDGKLRPGASFSANLMRADGTQGVILATSPDHGYILQVRMDQRQAWWSPWNGSPPDRWAHPPPPPPQFLVHLKSMAQFALRFFLPSMILALALIVLCTPATALLGLLIFPAARIAPRFGSLWRHFVGRMRVMDGLALIAAVAGTTATAWLATHAYRGVPPVQDGVAYLFQAKTLALGRIAAPPPPIASFFEQWSILIYHGHWFGKYQPGWPLLLAVGVLLRASWLVNPVLEGVGLLLVYFIGRELYDRRVGLLAVGLALTSPFFLFVGNAFYPEATTWLFLGLYVLLLLLWEKRDRSSLGERSFALAPGKGLLLLPAGLALGLAAATRQLDALAFCLPWLILFRRRPLASLWLGLATAIPVAAYLAYNHYLTGSFFGNAYELVNPWDHIGFGRTVGGPPGSYLSDFTFPRSLWNLASNLQNAQLGLFGWPSYFALAFAAVPFALGRVRRSDWLLLLSGVAIVGAYMTWWYQGLVQQSFPRYWYLIVPCVALLAARGVQELAGLPALALWSVRARNAQPAASSSDNGSRGLESVAEETTPLPVYGSRSQGATASSGAENGPAPSRSGAFGSPAARAAAVLAPLALIGLLIAFNVALYMPSLVADVRFWTSADRVAIEAAQRAHIHHALVFQVQQGSYWWPYGGVFPQNSPLLNSDIVWARDEGRKDVLLMRDFPGRAYYRLNNADLTRIYPKPPSAGKT